MIVAAMQIAEKKVWAHRSYRVAMRRQSLSFANRFRMRVHADGTVREFDVEPPVPIWGKKPWHLVQESVVAFQRHAIRALSGQEPGQPTGADNLKTFALTQAAIASAASGTAISLTHST